MSWKIRHEGSPVAVANLSLPQVVEGLQDGRWEPTDEVMGPQDQAWVAIEEHPQLTEVAAEIEPPPPKVYDDETRLDMNALIDVTLVLLIFFILTTTYAVLQKRLEAPGMQKNAPGPPRATKEQLERESVFVEIGLQGDQPVISVAGNPVSLDNLAAELRRYARSSGKMILALKCDRKVKHEVVVRVIDEAKEAGLERVKRVSEK